ncbi:MAG: SEC-C domain-containing protein [Acidobacteria bacterium]|nr:SEC-C domain-containing protein [Acidobacteriota bacterium]
MPSTLHPKTGRNDPCPCGSGKKYKRCCLQHESLSEERSWARQREASDQLTRELMRFAARKFGRQVDDAWQDFNMSDLPMPSVDRSTEDQIFMPYFLFHWDPDSRAKGRSAYGKGGIVTRWYMLERAARLSEAEKLFLDQAVSQPVSFYEVLRSEPGERMAIRDILTGGEIEVIERSASRTLRQGDITYAQVWNLPGLAILGCCAPICIPPDRKADVIGLRKKLRKRIAKQNRDLTSGGLIRYADDIRETYLNIRDALHTPPRLCNTDGDPLVLHSLTYRIESAEEAFEALAPLAVGRSKGDLLREAEFDPDGKLQRVNFDWLKKGNRKISSWDNTILGSITISRDSLVAEVNSEKRATRLHAEIEKRLGPSAVHQRTRARTPEEMLKDSPRRKASPAKFDDEELQDMLRDPEVRKRVQESLQKHVEAWVDQKVPLLGGRTPRQAVQDLDGREIVEALLLEWERRGEEKGVYPGDIRPDINAVRRLLNLMPPAP